MIKEIKTIFMQEISGKNEFIMAPRLLAKGEMGDVIAIRDSKNEMKRYTNIKWVFGECHSEADFEWGYSGAGPTDLAANILMHFTNHDESFTRRHYLEFRDSFVRSLPRAGGRIEKDDILKFIEERAPASQQAKA